MPYRKLSDTIPEIYHSFLPAFFQSKIPPEPFSDCSACPMTDEEGVDPGDDLSKPFSYETKCCTFTPRIPNYMVGGILSDPDPAQGEGKLRIMKKIRSRQGVLPGGLFPSKAYDDYFARHRKREFGRNVHLLCPYFQQGAYSCSIWKYREAICSFWYCKHLASRSGSIFWNSMIDYFKAIQESLAETAGRECNLPPDNEMTDYSVIWGSWEGREEDYYLRCYEIVKELPEYRTDRILDRGRDLLHLIQQAYEEFLFLPEYLSANKAMLEIAGANYQIELSSYIESTDSSVAWSFQLPRYIIDYFDGNRNTETVIGHIQEKHGLYLEPEILIALYRHDILQEVRQEIKRKTNN